MARKILKGGGAKKETGRSRIEVKDKTMSSPATFNAGARHPRLLQWRLRPHRLRHGQVNQEEGRVGKGASCTNQGAAGVLETRAVQDSCGSRCKEGSCSQKTGLKPRIQGRRPLIADWSTGRHEKTYNSEPDLDATLEKRFLRLKEKLHEFTNADSHNHILKSEVQATVEANKGKGKKTNNRASWADHKGGSLTSWCPIAGESRAATDGSCSLPSKDESFTGALYTQWKKKRIAPVNVPTPKASYKEVLLRYVPHLHPEPSKPSHLSSHFHVPNLVGRCFRCFAKDHKIR